ncbi:putative oxidoreductase [Streptomyces sp. RB17]|uniref:SDR family NAD(P)-dependent oxidoreductase n=1 Tax=Streptomyces sp. RB17 TaxID=2585197 RepID=UPI00129509C5|nr:SDR family NAD(P)-dependent oxidoreductase [Streptomyces sp. RB17]MQY34709.1 putative oxidoreductase [Streptomyces sp. RB17]
MRITGNVALITGGGSGLGLATAHRLVEAGGRVVLVDLPASDGARAAEELGDQARFVAADVTSAEQVARALDAAEVLGPLRAVVTCAGILRGIRLPAGDPVSGLAAFRSVLEVNLAGTFNVVQLAARRIAAQQPIAGERGVMVTTASVAAFDGQIGQAAYAASKAGVSGMTLPLARDLAESLIRVVSIAPGLFETPMLAGLPDAARAALGAQVPHPARLGAPDEYAALVEHVLTNPMLNGETVRLDGALRMAPR